MKLVTTIVVILAVAIVWAFVAFRFAAKPVVPPVPAPAVPTSALIETSDGFLNDHPVVVGGVHTLTELCKVVRQFQELYGDFDCLNAKLIQTKTAFWAKDSYRIGGKTLWTKHNKFIPAGTWVWMDEHGNLIEAKCGNALIRIQDTSAIEPFDVAQLEVPSAPDAPVQESYISWNPPPPLTPDPAIPPTNPPANPPVFVFCCGGGVPPSAPPPISTPEPSTIELLLAGLMILRMVR